MDKAAQEPHCEHPWRFGMLDDWQWDASFNHSVIAILEQNLVFLLSARDPPQCSRRLYIQTRLLTFQMLYGRRLYR